MVGLRACGTERRCRRSARVLISTALGLGLLVCQLPPARALPAGSSAKPTAVVSLGCLPQGLPVTQIAGVAVTDEYSKLIEVGGQLIDPFGNRVAFVAGRGEFGPVVVIGDSLAHQATVEIANTLHAAGWGPVCVDTAGGRGIQFSGGAPGATSGADAIARIKASAAQWSGRNVKFVIALGTNDAFSSASTKPRALIAIRAAQAAVGASDQAVGFVEVASRFEDAVHKSAQAAWNSALAEAGVEVLPFAEVIALKPGWIADDLVHLSTSGVNGFSRVVAYATRPVRRERSARSPRGITSAATGVAV